MTTTNPTQTDPTATYWKLEKLRSHLVATADEYAAAGPPLEGVAGALDFMLECIAETQAELACAVVKTAGPAEPR